MSGPILICPKCGGPRTPRVDRPRSYKCRSCARAYYRVYRQTLAGRAAILRGKRRFRATPKGKAAAKRYRAGISHQKRNASAAVQRAIKKGTLVREPCIICGDPKSEAHHFNYNRPLVVIWFCRRDHWRYHARQLTYVGG
jgi:hypothetical protein